MNNYFDKENVKNIKMINDYLGMDHRFKPYDFNNPKDLKEAFMQIASEFFDCYKLHSQINNLIETYDENLETYHAEDYAKLIRNDIPLKEHKTNINLKVYHSLKAADKDLDELYNISVKRCMKLMDYVFNCEERLQVAIFNKYYKLSAEQIKKFYDEFFDDPDCYDGVYGDFCVEEHFDRFIKRVRKLLG